MIMAKPVAYMNSDELLVLIKEVVRDVVREELDLAWNRKPDHAPEELIDSNEACQYLRISKVTLHKLLREGFIKSYRNGGRKHLFKKSELIRYP